MPNLEKKIELGKTDSGYRQELLEGKTFKFSEEEKAEKMKEGMSKKDIGEKEEEVIARQKLTREEKKEEEDKKTFEAEQKKVIKKPSLEEYKAKRDAEFNRKADEAKEAREKLEAAYQEEEEKMAA